MYKEYFHHLSKITKVGKNIDLLVINIFLILNIVIFILSLINSWSFAWIVISFATSIGILIPVTLFIEIYGRYKFKNEDIGPIKPLVENEK